MTIPASLSKLKSLFPVIVVGASVVITIKLLTESTPSTSEILQVKAEEDIFSPEYTEELVEPKEPEPEPEKPPKEDEPESQEKNTQPKEQTDEKSESEDDSKSNKDQQESQKQKEQDSQKQDQQPKSGRRAFKAGKDPVIGILRNFFSKKEK